MKLLPHEKISPDKLNALQAAVDSVVTAEAELKACGEELHLAAKRLPTGKEPEPSQHAESRRKEFCPGELKQRDERWHAMKATREDEMDFILVQIRHWESVLHAANTRLAAAIEEFRAYTTSIVSLPYQERDQLVELHAVWNVLACDNLCARVRSENGFNDWPKSVIGRGLPDEFQLREKFRANRRGFTYRYRTKTRAWTYDQGPGTHWLDARLPTTPCMTEREAELDAMGISCGISRKEGKAGAYLITVWDLENHKPGKLFLGRNVEQLDLDSSELPADAKVVDLFPPQPEWENDKPSQGVWAVF